MIFSESIISDLTELVSTEAPFILFCLFVCLFVCLLSSLFLLPSVGFLVHMFFLNEITEMETRNGKRFLLVTTGLEEKELV